MADVADFAASLELEKLDEGAFVRRPPVGAPSGFVFAGLVSAQMLRAITTTFPNQPPRSISSIYTAIIRSHEPYEIRVQPIHTGRQLTAVNVTAIQEGRSCASAVALLGPTVADLIRHSSPAPAGRPPPTTGDNTFFANLVGEVQVVEGIDLSRSDQSLPPIFSVWRRAGGLERDLHPAVVAHDANSFLPGTALLPHAGLGLADAHRTITTVITASEVAFHQPMDLEAWAVFENRSSFAGGGWAYGTGTVHSENGPLLASYTQQAMIRALPSKGHA
jgi:acyl-CoA thioesterase-2